MSKEASTVMVNGRLVLIRPIRADDAAMEAAFVRELSLETKHYRFFAGVKELSAGDVERLCTVDGRHSMAFVATVCDGNREVEIGVCRYAPDSKQDAREMAVTIADTWKHTDLAKCLMQRLIASARQYGIRELNSVELADNLTMRSFANAFGMVGRRNPDDANQVIYSLSL